MPLSRGLGCDPDRPLVGRLWLATDYPTLDFGDATHCVHNARRFRRQAFASVLYDLVLLDLGIDQFPELRSQALVGSAPINRA